MVAATCALPHDEKRPKQRLIPLCLVLGLSALVVLPGCGGCGKDPAEVEKEREKKLAEQRNKPKPKPDFEELRLVTQPTSARLSEPRQLAAEGREPPDRNQETLSRFYKPGHWTAITLATKANNFDFLGDLELAAVNRRGEPIPLPNTSFQLTTAREIALPKRQWKTFESLVFVPSQSQQVQVSCRLNPRKGGQRPWEVASSLSAMPSYQYHFVVLARFPDRYSYLKALPSFKPPSDQFTSERTESYYRTSLLHGDRPPLLPSYGLQWTSIACLLWDDAEPASLSIEQQQAMLDWLHWGGLLILSGPDTLDTLRNSFLAPYLPADGGKARELHARDFEPLRQWSTKFPALVPVAKWTGVPLQKRPGARFVPGSGELLVERRLGRGRIIVSAFRLSGRELTSWPGLDEFFNAFLLRRPARAFSASTETGLQVNWADDAAKTHRLDAACISNLRYFARDTGLTVAAYGADLAQAGADWDESQTATPGLGAWNDDSLPAGQARDALRNAAQIEIPDRRFVFWVVVGYLIVLVPVNWVVFRVVGRVEWAWVAAPVIAVVCTAVVIRLAQLDIGFARSRTEIAIVETQADYPRAHVTRYSALYTALTTNYTMGFQDSGGLAQPLPKASGPGATSDARRLLYVRGSETDLSGLFVESNSTGMVHSEQMLDLGGSLSLASSSSGELRLTNGTRYTLRGAGVVHLDEAGQQKAGWLGTLEPATTKRLALRPVAANLQEPLWSAERKEPGLTGSGLAPGELNLHALVQTAQRFEDLAPGGFRLVALVDEEIPGLQIDPAAPQSQQVSLLVAHLQHGHAPNPASDRNRLRDVQRGSPESDKKPESAATAAEARSP